VPRAPALHISRRLTIALWVLLAVQAIGIPLALRAAFRTARDETIVGQFERFARRTQTDDSWRPMEAARSYARTHPGGDIYEEIFFRRKVKFQYPPSSLLFVAGLSRQALNLVSWCCVWLTTVFTVLLFRKSMQAGDGAADRPPSADRLVGSLAVAGLSLAFYPLIKGYTLGQIQVWVDALFAASLWAWYSGRQAAAGVCLGLACLIKPPLVLLALWALVRRQGRMLAGMLATKRCSRCTTTRHAACWRPSTGSRHCPRRRRSGGPGRCRRSQRCRQCRDARRGPRGSVSARLPRDKTLKT